MNATAILSFGNIISNAVLAITSVVVARLLTPDGYGVYSLVLAMPLLLQLLTSFGVNTAIIRLSANYHSRGELQLAQRITKNGIIFLSVSGLVFTGLTVLLAGSLSSIFLHRPDVTEFEQIASSLILGQTILGAVSAAFIGWGDAFQVAIWTIVQAILKLVISVALILLGYGVLGGIYGYSLSLLIAGISGTGALYALRFRKSSANSQVGIVRTTSALNDFISDVKQMIRYGWPVYLGNVILTFSQQPIFVLILSAIAPNTVIGYYAAANVITTIVVLIGTSEATALFPAFSRLQVSNSDTRTAFRYAVKYSSYAIMPVVVFLIAASSDIIRLLYGAVYLPASYILQLLTLSFLPYAFGQVVLPSYFNGVGKTRLTLYMNLVETLATLVAAFVLVFLLKLGVLGVLYTIILSNILPTAFGLYWAKMYLGAVIDVANLFRTYLVSVACYFVLYAFTLVVTASSSAVLVLKLILESAIFLGVYLTLAPLARMVEAEDITRLRISSDSLGIIRKLLHPILDYESYLIRLVLQE